MLAVNLRIANSRPSRIDYRAPHFGGCLSTGLAVRDAGIRNVMAICVELWLWRGWTVLTARADLSLGQIKSGKVDTAWVFLEGCSAAIDESIETRSRPGVN